jgi:two-component system NarL family response regulator
MTVRVLLVDDSRLLLEGLQSLLEANGVEVVGAATDGLESVALACALEPEVILMDVRMPGCDGLEATRRIKARMPGARIVMLTTSADEEDLFEAIRSGACGYLIKSIDTEALVEALEQARQGIPPFSPGLAARLLSEFARTGAVADPAPASPRAAANTDPAPPDSALTPRQMQVLRLVADGMSYREVGARLQLSPRTVKYHMGEIMERLHLKGRAQVLAHAGRMGWAGDAADSRQALADPVLGDSPAAR